jgi:hypothetical protein
MAAMDGRDDEAPPPGGGPEPTRPAETRARAPTQPPPAPVPPAERDPRDRDGDGLPDTLRQRLEAMVPEIVKRTFQAGLGAVFSTEESIRKVAKDLKDTDVAGYIASSADGAKDKVLEVIARETREFLQQMNLSEEIAKILTMLSFEIKTEIRFIPNSERFGGIEPDIKAGVRLKKNDAAISADKDRDGKPDKPADDKDDKDRPSRLRFWRRGERDDPDSADEGADDPLDRDD